MTEIFNGTDRVIVNLECAVTDKNTPIKKIGPNINAPKNTIKALTLIVNHTRMYVRRFIKPIITQTKGISLE